MRILFLSFCLACLFCMPAFSDGKAVYDKSCKACHGAEGQGNPGMAKMLKVEIKHLGSKEVQAKSDAQLKKDVTEGVGKMKPVKLAAKEADEIVAFIRTLKQ
jgi:cytochrome c5